LISPKKTPRQFEDVITAAVDMVQANFCRDPACQFTSATYVAADLQRTCLVRQPMTRIGRSIGPLTPDYVVASSNRELARSELENRNSSLGPACSGLKGDSQFRIEHAGSLRRCDHSRTGKRRQGKRTANWVGRVPGVIAENGRRMPHTGPSAATVRFEPES